MNNLSPELSDYLEKWFRTSTRNQAAKGIEVQLSYPEFLSLFEKRQLTSLQKAIDDGRLGTQQHEENPFAYVLSWKSYAACSSNVFSKETACVCSRQKSAAINLPAPGDKLRPGHKANIGKALKGKPKTEDHKKAISEGSKGGTKTAWTPERRQKRSELRRAQEVAKRSE